MLPDVESMGRETKMKGNALPEGADALLAFAEAIATVLAEKHEELDMDTDVEALLRASIAAATFAIDAYIGILAGAKRSRVAQGCLREAKARCYRSVEQLRRRVRYSIAHLSRVVDEKQLVRGLEYAPL